MDNVTNVDGRSPEKSNTTVSESGSEESLKMEMLREEIKKAKWQFAKTMAKTCPHEYVTYSKEYETLFKLMDEKIKKDGYTGKFGKSSYKYVNVDDHKYWFTFDREKGLRILNREPLKK